MGGVSAPVISIVLPFRDAAATLDQAIASLRAQSLGDWELIAVDDHSADDSVARVHAQAREDSRVRLAANPGRGLVSALNEGLRLARAPFVARMDADDTCAPDRLYEQFNYLEHHPSVGLVGCQVEFGGNLTQAAGYARHVAWLNRLVDPAQIRRERFIESPFAHPSVLFRRELVEQFGGYREGDFPEDYELWLRWAEAGVVYAKVPKLLLTWRDAPGRLSRRDARYAPDKFFAVKAPYVAAELARQFATRGTRKVWVWGAGRLTRKRAGLLEPAGAPITGFIDIDPKKCGRSVTGRPVVLPDRIPPPDEAFVLGYVANWGAHEVIRQRLGELKYVEGENFLLCA